MKKNLIVLSILALFIFSSFGMSADITNCGTIKGDSVLIQDIKAYGSCFQMSNDVVFDCQGYTIHGSMNTGDAIYANGKTGFTIKNCVISNFEKPIRLVGSSNNIIEDITIRSSTMSIEIEDGSNNNMISGIDISSSILYGIRLRESSGNKLSDIVVDNVGYYALSISESPGTEVTNTQLTNNDDGLLILHSEDVYVSGLTSTSNKNRGFLSAGDIVVGSLDNHTLKDSTLNSNGIGIEIRGSSNSLFENNIANENDYGMRISGRGHKFRGNSMADNEIFNLVINLPNMIDLSIYGYSKRLDIDTTNTVDDREVWYLADRSEEIISIDENNIGYLACIGCSNVVIQDGVLDKNGQGIYFYNTVDSVIQNVITNSNYYGVYLRDSHNNQVIDVTTQANVYDDSGIGIFMTGSTGNTIRDSTIDANDFGAVFTESDSNIVYHNNFLDNTVQVDDSQAALNNWHEPTLSEGNYWSDYEGFDLSGDGIGDTGIPHPTTGYDMYPLVPPCVLNEDCAPGYFCEEGVCIEIVCLDDDDCPDGICVDNECIDCLIDDDCIDGVCLDNVCVECKTTDDCLYGVCVDNMCVECAGDNDCPPDMICEDNVCMPDFDSPVGFGESQTFQGVLAKEPVEMTTTKDLSVSNMLISIQEDSDLIVLRIEEFDSDIYDNKLDTAVYKYLLITASEPVATVDINFKVLNSWILDHGLLVDDVALFHYYQDETRIELDTEILSKDDVYTYFKATTESFSLFEIGEKGDEKEISVDVDTTVFEDGGKSDILGGKSEDNNSLILIIIVGGVLLFVLVKLVMDTALPKT